MTFKVPESKRSIRQNQFEFQVPGDRKTYRIPKAKYLSIGQVEALASKGDEVQITDILEILGQGEAREAVRTLDQEQLMALMEAWQDDSGITVGGILGLHRDLLSKGPARQALQYDLLVRGLSLEDLGEAFTWYDLLAFSKHVQQETNSALARELHGPAWSVEGQLMAIVADHLAVANWQRAGRKSAPKPQRIPRPWEKPKTTVLGKGAIPLTAFADWWDSRKSKRSRKRAKKPPTD
ncbi:tail assembly chaperone [Microbacterium phage FlameThrower]|nr:tail assembly chaperone [Microbacterium phage FlameThrower]